MTHAKPAVIPRGAGLQEQESRIRLLDENLARLLQLRDNSFRNNKDYLTQLAENAYEREEAYAGRTGAQPSTLRRDTSSALLDGHVLAQFGDLEGAVQTARSSLRLGRTILELGRVRLPVDHVSFYVNRDQTYLKDVLRERLEQAGITPESIASRTEDVRRVTGKAWPSVYDPFTTLGVLHGVPAEGTLELELDLFKGYTGTLSLHRLHARQLTELQPHVLPSGLLGTRIQKVEYAQNLAVADKRIGDHVPATLHSISVYTKDDYGNRWSVHCKGPMEIPSPGKQQ